MTKTAGVYVRISKDREGAEHGVKRQQADCEALCERLGWQVGGIYVDNDISAYSGKRRPEYRRLLEDLKNGAVDAVLAWHPDRLHRRPVELEEFIDVIEMTGAAVEMVTAGRIDLSTASGRFVARNLGNAARYESEHKSERHRRKALELAQNGQVGGGGLRPFGYENDRLTVKADEAALIREAAERLLAGESLRSIALDWNDRGEDTVSGGLWTSTVIRGVMKSPRIAGLREHNGTVVGAAVWPAIIDEGTHRRLHAILTDPARKLSRAPRKYFLSGILRCGRCGGPLVSRPRTTGKRSYCCPMTADRSRCGKTSLLAEELEEIVAEMIFEAIDTNRMAEAIAQRTDGDDDALAAQIAEDREALEQLAKDHYADKLISRAEFLAARDAIEKRLQAGERSRAQVRGIEALTGLPRDGNALRDAWPTLGLDRKQAIVKAAFDRIIIKPVVKGRNRFDAGRIEPIWRV
jgi:DNA invertase Pin-like site-specific DNA recombinase